MAPVAASKAASKAATATATKKPVASKKIAQKQDAVPASRAPAAAKKAAVKKAAAEKESKTAAIADKTAAKTAAKKPKEEHSEQQPVKSVSKTQKHPVAALDTIQAHIDRAQVAQAVKALSAFMQRAKLESDKKAAAAAAAASAPKKAASKKPLLIDDDDEALLSSGGAAATDDIWLVITTKRIPAKKTLKPIRIPLPNSLLRSGAEVCLITKDPQHEFKDLIEAANVSQVTKVIGLSKLRSNYKPYEARRQLVASYDRFLADARIIPALPKVLGKAFFAKKKQPVAVDLTKKNVKAEILSALNSTYMHSTTGASRSIKVASLHLTADQIVDNVVEAAKNSILKISGKINNILSLSIKSSTSIALPFYNSLPYDPEADDEMAGDEDEDDEDEEEADDAEDDS